MAVDDQADPALIYLGTGERVADLGDRLELKGNIRAMLTGPFCEQAAGLEGVIDPGLHLRVLTEEVYAGKWRVFDGRTGKLLRRMKFSVRARIDWGGEIGIGPDRYFYLAGNNGLFRFDPQGKSVPFANGKLEVKGLFGGHGNSNRGHCIGPDGDIYFVHHYHGHGNTQVCVSQVGRDGTIKRYQFISNPCTSGSGVRVDRQGNVYVGMAVKPADQLYPPFFRGRLPEHVAYPRPWFYYRQMYGSIVKFRPGGGRVVRDPNGDCLATNYSYFHRCRI